MHREEGRTLEATRLAELMSERRPFSFLRMGDGELRWLLEMQAGVEQTRYRYADESNLSNERIHGTGGLEPRFFERLKRSYENCSYLDLQSDNGYNAENLHQLQLNRGDDLFTNDAPETGTVFYTWVARHLREYTAEHRCLFASAEADLLEQLWLEPGYREASSRLWSSEASPVFHQVRGDGRHYSQQLDLIKEDLRAAVGRERIDTLFLSLAGAAKILCFELAEELSIAAFDLGAISRGLVYAASPGYQNFRARHHPYFFRVPLDLFVAALERARPGLDAVSLLAKAQAQLCRELQRKEFGRSFADEAYEPRNLVLDTSNLKSFRVDMAFYRSEVLPVAKADRNALRLHEDFQAWCARRGVGRGGSLGRWLRARCLPLRQLLDRA